MRFFKISDGRGGFSTGNNKSPKFTKRGKIFKTKQAVMLHIDRVSRHYDYQRLAGNPYRMVADRLCIVEYGLVTIGEERIGLPHVMSIPYASMSTATSSAFTIDTKLYATS